MPTKVLQHFDCVGFELQSTATMSSDKRIPVLTAWQVKWGDCNNCKDPVTMQLLFDLVNSMLTVRASGLIQKRTGSSLTALNQLGLHLVSQRNTRERQMETERASEQQEPMDEEMCGSVTPLHTPDSDDDMEVDGAMFSPQKEVEELSFENTESSSLPIRPEPIPTSTAGPSSALLYYKPSKWQTGKPRVRITTGAAKIGNKSSGYFPRLTDSESESSDEQAPPEPAEPLYKDFKFWFGKTLSFSKYSATCTDYIEIDKWLFITKPNLQKLQQKLEVKEKVAAVDMVKHLLRIHPSLRDTDFSDDDCWKNVAFETTYEKVRQFTQKLEFIKDFDKKKVDKSVQNMLLDARKLKIPKDSSKKQRTQSWKTLACETSTLFAYKPREFRPPN